MKRSIIWILFLSLLIFEPTGSIFAQRKRVLDPPKKYNLESPNKGGHFRYYTYNYDINSNLNSNSLRGLSIDTNGRVWIVGENSGFGVLDGQNLYNFGGHNGLFDRYTHIHADKFGRIWAGGNGVGIVTFDTSLVIKWYVDIGQTISDVHINGITSDSKGNAWISTGLGGISCIKEDTTLMYTVENTPLSHPNTKHIAINRYDIVWALATHADSIFYIKDYEFHWFTNYNRDSINFDKICGSYQSDVMGITKSGDLYLLSPERAKKVEIEFTECDPIEIRWAQYDNFGKIYFGDGQHIFQLVEGKAKLIVDGTQQKLQITDIQFDDQNDLWFATRGHGLFHIPDPSILRFVNRQLFYSSEKIVLFYTEDKTGLESVSIDDDGVISWKSILTFKSDNEKRACYTLTNGLYIREKNGTHHFIDYNGNTHPVTDPVLKNAIKIESYEGLDYYLDENRQLVFNLGFERTAHDYRCHDIRVFHKEEEKYYFWSEDIDRNYYQLGKYESGEIELIFDSIPAENYKVTGAHYLNDTTFLIPTWGMFMFKITPNTVENMTEGFGTNILYVYRSDKDRNFWIGGIEGGINYVDGKSLFVYNLSEKDGLQGARVSDFYIAENNELIITTTAGVGYLRIIDPLLTVNSEEDFFKKYQLEFYSNRDGLWGEHFGWPFIDREGRIWVSDRSRVLQIIHPNSHAEKPDHLKIEFIYKTKQDEEPSRMFSWLPATVYDPPREIELNYDEGLSVHLKATYFVDHNELYYEFKVDDQSWSIPQSNNVITISGLSSGEHDVYFRGISNKGESTTPFSIKVSVIPPFYQTTWFILCSIFVGLGLIFLIFKWRVQILKNRQRELEQTVEERTEEIRIQKIEIETQHGEIKDSIAYAKRIQEAILPPNSLIRLCLPESFVLYKPKDIVAGDFYWLEENYNKVHFAVADCTGHGVPGAMVSVVCHNAIVRSVREFKKVEPAEILDQTRELVIQRFEQGKREVNDGMDISLCLWDKEKNKLYYSGANNNLYLFRKGELVEFKSDKQPIGKFHDPKPFTQHEIDLEKDDTIYIFTDGYADQFGGDKGKKFKSSHFKSLLQSLQGKSMNHQMADIDRAFEIWKGELEQLDDVCIIGVKF